MATMKSENPVDPVDSQVGGDGDIGGIAQTITEDDITTLTMSSRPVAERAEELRQMRAELEARLNADRGGEIMPLLEAIDRSLAMIDPPEGASAQQGGDMLDREGKSHLASPEDALENAEENAERGDG